MDCSKYWDETICEPLSDAEDLYVWSSDLEDTDDEAKECPCPNKACPLKASKKKSKKGKTKKNKKCKECHKEMQEMQKVEKRNF